MRTKRLWWLWTALLAGAVAVGQESMPPDGDASPLPLVTHDEQGRMIRHVIFDPDGNVLQMTTYEYIDKDITLQTITVIHGASGWTVTESLSMADTGVRLNSVREYDAEGELMDEKLVVIHPGSRPFRIPEDL